MCLQRIILIICILNVDIDILLILYIMYDFSIFMEKSAGFWIRFFASIIDGIPFYLLGSLIAGEFFYDTWKIDAYITIPEL